jgi:hypothetical protein
MAKPIALFQGPAPAAQAMMGQGLDQVGANIARSYMQGSQAMGEGIMKGVSAIANQYQQYKTAKASNDIARSIISDPTLSNSILGIPAGEEGQAQRDAILKQFKEQIDNHGQIGGAMFSQQILGPLQHYAMLGRQHAMELEKQRQSPAWGGVANEAAQIPSQIELRRAQTRQAEAAASARETPAPRDEPIPSLRSMPAQPAQPMSAPSGGPMWFDGGQEQSPSLDVLDLGFGTPRRRK